MRAYNLRGATPARRAKRGAVALPGLRARDLVRRDSFGGAPNHVWVAASPHGTTSEGWMYVSCLKVGHARRILGVTARSSMGAELVTSELLQAVSVRRRSNQEFVANGVIPHSDGGAQYVSLALTEKFLAHGVAGSIGRIGTAHANALLECIVELCKPELTNRRAIGSDSRQEHEAAAARWVAWFSGECLHGEIGYRPLIEVEMDDVQIQRLQWQAALGRSPCAAQGGTRVRVPESTRLIAQSGTSLA